MAEEIASTAAPRNNLLMVAAGGLVSGILTTWLPALVDIIVGTNGRFPLVQFRLALIALPFAVLVFVVAVCARYIPNKHFGRYNRET